MNKSYLTSKPNITAFKNAIRVIESTPDKNFDMGNWECGTKGCVAGSCAKDPWFIKRGFVLNRNREPSFNNLLAYDAIREFFKIGFKDSEVLFGPNDPINPCEIEKLPRSVMISRFQSFIKKNS